MPGTSNSGGRNRKSQREHALGGTGRKGRGTSIETAIDAPDPPKGRPIPPKTLTGEARVEWDRMVVRLKASKTLLSVVDDAVLYRYCQLHARAERLEREIANLPDAFYIDHVGNPKVHPAFAQIRAYDQALRGYLVEFGMTPAARSRVKVPIPEKTPVKSKWAGLLQ